MEIVFLHFSLFLIHNEIFKNTGTTTTKNIDFMANNPLALLWVSEPPGFPWVWSLPPGCLPLLVSDPPICPECELGRPIKY